MAALVAGYPVVLAAVSAAGVVVLPGARYLAGVSFGIFPVWVSLAGFVLLLTPTGRCPRPGGGGGPGSRRPG